VLPGLRQENVTAGERLGFRVFGNESSTGPAPREDSVEDAAIEPDVSSTYEQLGVVCSALEQHTEYGLTTFECGRSPKAGWLLSCSGSRGAALMNRI